MKQFVYKYWLQLILIFIILLLGVAMLTKRQSPPLPAPTPSSFISTPEGKSNSMVVEYVGKNLILPETTPTYQYESQSPKSFASSLANDLNLRQHPQSNNLWQDANLSLNYVEENGQIDITFNVQANAGPGINSEQSSQRADEYVRSIGLNNAFLLTDRAIFTNEFGEFSNTQSTKLTPASASLIIIPFSYQANNVPIFFEDSRATDSIIVLNSKNEITKISFTSPPPKIIAENSAPPITLEEAIQKIEDGEGTFIHLELGQRDTVPANQLVSLNLSRVEFEYRLLSGHNKIVPYLHFYGAGRTHNNTEIVTEVLVEAIR